MPFHTTLDIISTTALDPYREKEGMYVYTHTYMHKYNYNGGVGYEFQCAQVQSNTTQVNTILHVHNQRLYDYFNLKAKTSVSGIQICQMTKIHTFQ